MTIPDDILEELRLMEERLGATDEPEAVVFEVEPGRWENIHGNPVDPDREEPLMVIELPEVMSWERAEREGREIYETVDDPHSDTDLVKVRREGRP